MDDIADKMVVVFNGELDVDMFMSENINYQ